MSVDGIKAERLRGGQVDNKIKFGRLLHRKITRLCAPQNFVDQVSGATEKVWKICAIRHQTSRFDVLSRAVDRWQSCGQRQSIDASPLCEDKWAAPG
jgi:hypothetical protein